MELITQKIRQCIEKVKDMSQVGFDRDYVIKDNKPDVSKVVCQNGQVKIDEIKASGENIWISGSIEMCIRDSLYNMLEKEFINGWFTRWAAAAVIVSIPISILFVIMQRFYVDGLTGAVKG